MNLLLDTHTTLWWLADAPMEDEAQARIADPDPDTVVAVSAVSIWEIAIKQAMGKLRFEGSIADHAARAGFEPVRISFAHAERAGGLAPHHRDPFDRMLIAQAEAEHLVVVTRDGAFDPYEIDVLRC